jgi:hypothetical protein
VARSRRSSLAETSMSESPYMGATEVVARSEVAGGRWGNPRSPAGMGWGRGGEAPCDAEERRRGRKNGRRAVRRGEKKRVIEIWGRTTVGRADAWRGGGGRTDHCKMTYQSRD